MTILNIHLEAGRALVASNSEIVRIDGTMGNMCKLFAIPHANAIVCFRGQAALAFTVFIDCFMASTEFDDLAETFGSIAGTRYANFQNEVQLEGVNVALETQVALVGWSQSKGAMDCLLWQLDPSGKASVSHVDDVILSPWFPEWEKDPVYPTDASAMISMAKRQALQSERAYPGRGWLGDLNIAEITKNSMVLKTVPNFSL